MLMKDLLGNVSFRKSRMRFEQVVIAHSDSKRAHPIPLPDICRAFVISSVPAVGKFVGNLCLGVGHLSILLEADNSVLFLYFT